VLEEFIRSRLGDDQNAVEAARVAVDATAILPESGEAIWYYRGSVERLLGADTTGDFLFRGRSTFWRPMLPVGVNVARPVVDSRPMSAASEASGQMLDAHRTGLIRLVGVAAGDFVASFWTAGGR
jgi:hypothetical protein